MSYADDLIQDLLNIGLILGIPEMMNLDVTSIQNDNRRAIQKHNSNANQRNREKVAEAIASGDFSDLNQDEDLCAACVLIRDSIMDFKCYFDGHIL